MERNKLETALRCLDVALHPNTDDDEVIAAVNGFRRTAAGASLREIYAVLGEGNGDPRRSAAGDTTSHAANARLSRENAALRRRIEEETRERIDVLRRLEAAERRAHALDEEIQATTRRAEEMARDIADLRAAYRAASEAANRQTAVAAPRPASPFQVILTAARQRAGDPDWMIGHPATVPNPRTPWTA